MEDKLENYSKMETSSWRGCCSSARRSSICIEERFEAEERLEKVEKVTRKAVLDILPYVSILIYDAINIYSNKSKSISSALIAIDWQLN